MRNYCVFSNVNNVIKGECHPNSAKKRNSISGACDDKDCKAIRNLSGAKCADEWHTPRWRHVSGIYAFWQDMGILEWRNGGKGGGGDWYVPDMVNAPNSIHHKEMWLRLNSDGKTNSHREGFADMSHLVAAENGGHYCGGNLLPEATIPNGIRAKRSSKADRDIRLSELSPLAISILEAWPSWWLEHRARDASRGRLNVPLRA